MQLLIALYISDNLINQHKIIGLKGQPTYYTSALKYQNNKLTVSVLGAYEKNGDFTSVSLIDANKNLTTPTVVFYAKGFELFSNYNFKNFSIHAGYNLYVPDVKSIPLENNQQLLANNFKVNDIIIGGIYQPINFIQIYAEQRLSYGYTAQRKKDFSVFTLGMIIDISKKFTSSFTYKKKSI